LSDTQYIVSDLTTLSSITHKPIRTTIVADNVGNRLSAVNLTGLQKDSIAFIYTKPDVVRKCHGEECSYYQCQDLPSSCWSYKGTKTYFQVINKSDGTHKFSSNNSLGIELPISKFSFHSHILYSGERLIMLADSYSDDLKITTDHEWLSDAGESNRIMKIYEINSNNGDLINTNIFHANRNILITDVSQIQDGPYKDSIAVSYSDDSSGNIMIIDSKNSKMIIDKKIGKGKLSSIIYNKYDYENKKTYFNYINKGMSNFLDKKGKLDYKVLSITDSEKLKKEFKNNGYEDGYPGHSRDSYDPEMTLLSNTNILETHYDGDKNEIANILDQSGNILESHSIF
jgi:SepF-like predicted cell division protein (DUF552 family)